MLKALPSSLLCLCLTVCLTAGCTESANKRPGELAPVDEGSRSTMSLGLSGCVTFLMNVPVDEQWARQQLPSNYTLATLPTGKVTMDIWSSTCASATMGDENLGSFNVSWIDLPIADSNDVLHPLAFAVVTTIEAAPVVLKLAQRVSPTVQPGQITFLRDSHVEVIVQGTESSYKVTGASQSPATSRFPQNVTHLHSNGTMWIDGIVMQDDTTHASTFEPLTGPTTNAPLAGAPIAAGSGRVSRGDYEFSMAAGFIDDANASLASR